MTPRAFFGLVVHGDNVFVHGGDDGKKNGDFLSLNLKTFVWTTIEAFRLSSGLADLSLSRASHTEIVVLGGFSSDRKHPTELRILDVAQHQERKQPLSAEFLGDETGVWGLRAIQIPQEGGMWVVCLGGRRERNYSPHMLVLDISY